MRPMKSSLLFALVVVLASVSLLAFSAPAYADRLEVLPTDHDFGDVEVGTTVTTIIIMTNINGSAVTVERIEFQAGGSADFSVANAPDVPFSLIPGEGAEVEVAFTPSADGYVSAALEIESTDWSNPIQTVSFGGVGVFVQPSVTIEDRLAFFDASVAAGTIDGTGPTDQARMNHLKVFRSILLLAADAIDDGKTELACQVLERSYLPSDG